MEEKTNVHESVLEAARLVQKMRRDKKWSQEKLAEEMGVSRHSVLRLEMGTKSKVDLVTVALAAETCGKRLTLSSQSMEVRHGRPETILELEEEIILAFSKGNLREAEENLNLIKNWIYPAHQIMAKANREVGKALNFYFKGKKTYAVSYINQMIMGLGMCGFTDKAKEISDRFQRHVANGNKSIEAEILRSEQVLAEKKVIK